MSAPNPSTPEATRSVPFDLPLQRGDYGDDICNDSGELVISIYGDERTRETKAKRDYLIRAVNSYDDMLAALKKLTGLIRDCHNVFQNHSASWLMQQPSFANAEEVIRKAESGQ